MNELYMQQQQTANTLAEILLQQATRMMQLQASAARALLRTQARSYAALGGPDWSQLFGTESERRFDNLLQTTTEQSLSFLRQTNHSMFELQQAINGLIVRQTDELSAQIRSNMEQIGQQVQQTAAKAHQTAQQATGIVQAASGMEGTRARRSETTQTK